MDTTETYQIRISKLLKTMNKKRPWLAQRSGVPVGTINGWFRGRIPRADHLLSVAKVLGTSVEYLLEGRDYANVDKSPARSRMVRWIDQLSDDSVQQLEKILEAMGDFSLESLRMIKKELD
ncbi:MAG: helix-turn-helix domain-containing protein [Spirochaetales bacterium]|nr:helix-turn-helix domain-containing protein [Spirochaetales bacterium]